jgi:anion-transporting  ArsA/GET3 family ATPase
VIDVVTPRLLIVAGSGGVGKTTTAAALGLAAARLGRRVLVLTVDPARRLADAIGLGPIGNEVVRVPLVGASGTLSVAMIDTSASWDDLVRSAAPDATTRDRLLGNALYRNLTSRFVHSHDYIAMERLYSAYLSGEHDLVVVDTPPSRNALDLLDAPGRMEEFFSSRLLRLLTAPSQSRLLSFASRPFFQVADRILGARFLADISEFFGLMRTMESGFVERARRVAAVLRSDEARFVVVTTAEPAPLAETTALRSALADRGLHLAGVVVNRLVDPLVLAAAGASPTVTDPASLLPGVDPARAERVVSRLLSAGRATRQRAAREQEVVERLWAEVPSVATCPWVAQGSDELATLGTLALHLGAR